MDGISFIIFWILPEQSSEHISIFRVVNGEIPQGHCSFEIAEILGPGSRPARAEVKPPGFLRTAQIALAVHRSYRGLRVGFGCSRSSGLESSPELEAHLRTQQLCVDARNVPGPSTPRG